MKVKQFLIPLKVGLAVAEILKVQNQIKKLKKNEIKSMRIGEAHVQVNTLKTSFSTLGRCMVRF